MNEQQNEANNTGNDGELREVCSFKGFVDRSVYAGVKEQEGWWPNTMVTVEQYEKAVARFMES